MMEEEIDEDGDPFVAFHEWNTPEEDKAWEDL
jgi:hypothetical protein